MVRARDSSDTAGSAGRLPSLDVLRAIAVLLVLGRHLEPHSTRSLLTFWQRGGWVGVDLFFVLSGFLVGGLLFREFVTTGRVRPIRFLVRRGFKIYPAFYVCLFAFLSWSPSLPPKWIWSEALFVQDYVQPVFNHTWSLAVEEHFYLLLAILVPVLIRLGRIALIPKIAVGVCVTLLLWRCANVWLLGQPPTDNLFLTHLRLDSLMFGVLLAYLHHFHGERVLQSISRWRPPLLICGTLMFLPAFVLDVERSAFLPTFGLTLFYLGAGMILLGSIVSPPPKTIPMRLLARLGACSYCVYLWHIPVQHWLGQGSELSYLVLSIATGIITTLLIERPFLRLRDRLLKPSTTTGNPNGFVLAPPSPTDDSRPNPRRSVFIPAPAG